MALPMQNYVECFTNKFLKLEGGVSPFN